MSDLHYTHKDNPVDIIVPGMAFADEITDAIVEETIARKPDALILTGDNTNGGGKEDALLLAEKLKRVKDAGIRVIITTGNHDFNQSDAAGFEKEYSELIEPEDRDGNSLSYTVIVDGIVFLAMDDNAVHPGGRGEFSDQTLRWLEQMLEKYRDMPVIFLSHHNVLVGKEAENSSTYRIQNEGLLPLLKRCGVRLAFTGHLHQQMLAGEDGFYEIVSAMPFAGKHTLGFLEIEGRKAVYHTEAIDFASYAGEEFAGKLAEKDDENGRMTRDSLGRLIEKSGYTPQEQEKILDMVVQFFAYYAEGSMGAHIQELKEDPVSEMMVKALWDYNYGPWMKSVLESEPLDASRLELELP